MDNVGRRQITNSSSYGKFFPKGLFVDITLGKDHTGVHIGATPIFVHRVMLVSMPDLAMTVKTIALGAHGSCAPGESPFSTIKVIHDRARTRRHGVSLAIQPPRFELLLEQSLLLGEEGVVN
jgi:hypothetical protein